MCMRGLRFTVLTENPNHIGAMTRIPASPCDDSKKGNMLDAHGNVTANGRDRKDNAVEFPWSEKRGRNPSLIPVGYASCFPMHNADPTERTKGFTHKHTHTHTHTPPAARDPLHAKTLNTRKAKSQPKLGG